MALRGKEGYVVFSRFPLERHKDAPAHLQVKRDSGAGMEGQGTSRAGLGTAGLGWFAGLGWVGLGVGVGWVHLVFMPCQCQRV